MARPHARFASVVAALAAATACRVPDGGARAVTVTDSAGVSIRAHPGGPVDDTVSLDGALTIGREGAPDYEFFRAVMVAGLASGNIVVANSGTQELLFYGADGSFLRRAGGPGEGPAEFGFVTTVYSHPGDTLVVMDPRRRRLVYLDSAGVFVRGESFAEDLTTAPPTPMCFFPGLAGLLVDGTRLTRGWGCMEITGSDGIRPTTMTLEMVRGERRATVGRFNAYPIWERRGGQGPAAFEILPFGHVLRWATGRDRVYVSDGVRYQVDVYDAGGQLVEIYREDATPAPVTAADREAYTAQRIEAGDPLGDDVPFPEHFGAYDRLLVAHEGDVWARWAGGPNLLTRRWTIYLRNGEAVRRLDLPDIDVHSVRDGRIYGSRANDLGVEEIVVLDDPGGW